MADEIAIKVDHLRKNFKLPHQRETSIKSALINFRKWSRKYQTQKALNNVTFEIKKGEFFGIVGRNGSGKSTLLKMLAGIYPPDKGTININGKLTPFIELGVGFNQELTGKENVFLNGALLGFSRKEMRAIYDDIVEFAEIEEFMDQKLKNYSSGMQVRLAFSIAIRAKSDILLIDEVLAVGDAAFQTKCMDYFNELKAAGQTVVFVSHDRGSLEKFCDQAILIDKGVIIARGETKSVLNHYDRVVMKQLETKDEERRDAAPKNEAVSITNLKLTDQSGNEIRDAVPFGTRLTTTFYVKFKQPVEDPIIGITLWRDGVGSPIYATNTWVDGQSTAGAKKGKVYEYVVTLPEQLNTGKYFIEPAVANKEATYYYERITRAKSFLIMGSDNLYSIVMPSKGAQLRDV